MRRFRSLIFTIVIFLILALDFAAFNDISTGVESNYTAEAAITILSLPTLVGLLLLSNKSLHH